MQGSTFKAVENNCVTTDKSVFYSFVPKESNRLLACWIAELNINIKVSNPRKTKPSLFSGQVFPHIGVN